MADESEHKLKFAFNYKLMHPGDGEAFSFEEIRAVTYYREYEIRDKVEAKYREKLTNLEKEVKEKEAKLEQEIREKEAALKELERKRQETATSGQSRLHTKSALSRHGMTTMFANGADYTTTVDNFTNVTQFEHVTANVTGYRDRSKMQRVAFAEPDDESVLAARSMCPPPAAPDMLEAPSILEDGLTAKLERIKAGGSNKTVFCDEAESLDSPATKTAKMATVNTLQAREALKNMLGNLGNDSTLDDEAPPTPTPAAFGAASDSLFVRPDTICIQNDVSMPKLSQAEFSVFKDAENEPPETAGSAKKAPAAARKPLQSLATNPPEYIVMNESCESFENTSLFGSHTAKIDFEPPAASTRNLKPLLNAFRENGGLRASRFFSPNERTLHPIIDDSLELSAAAPPKPPAAEAAAPAAQPVAASVVAGEQPSVIKIEQDESIKIPDISQFAFTEPLPRHLPPIENHSEIDDTSAYKLQTKKLKASCTENELEFDYNYFDIKKSASAATAGCDEGWMLDIPDAKDITNEMAMAIDRAMDRPIGGGQEKSAAAGFSAEEAAAKLLTTDRYEQSFKMYFRICCDMPSVDESSNKSVIKPSLEKTYHDMSIMMHRQVEEEDEELVEAPKPANLTTAELNKLRMTLNNTELRSPSVGGDLTFSAEDEMNASSLTTMHTRTGPLNDTIVNSVQNPFNFEVKNRLLNRKALEYLKKKSNYVSVMVKGPVVREKVNIMFPDPFRVVSEIGKGAYAKIYLIESTSGDKDKRRKLALKVDSNSTAWEFYITETIHDRIARLKQDGRMRIDVSGSFVRMHQFMKYNDGCLSTMDYYKNGSLLDLINYHVKKNENFPYWFVIYLTLEMLNIVDYLHKCRIIHADIKPDNLLIARLPDRIEYFDPSRSKCLVLIDFNRSIDLNLLPDEAEFDAKTDNKSLLCCEMKSNKTWTYQIDYFGVLSSMHCIIFKKYMNTYRAKDDSGRNKITNSIPRTFDKLFADFFDTFLNIPSCQELPDLEKEWIQKFEQLFKTELGTNFYKYDKYLKALNSTDLHAI